MASPSTVLSFGFGSWGSVNLLPTLGFGSGSVVVPDYLVCLHGRNFRVVTLTGANHRTCTLAGRNHRTVTLPGSQSGPC